MGYTGDKAASVSPGEGVPFGKMEKLMHGDSVTTRGTLSILLGRQRGAKAHWVTPAMKTRAAGIAGTEPSVSALYPACML